MVTFAGERAVQKRGCLASVGARCPADAHAAVLSRPQQVATHCRPDNRSGPTRSADSLAEPADGVDRLQNVRSMGSYLSSYRAETVRE